MDFVDIDHVVDLVAAEFVAVHLAVDHVVASCDLQLFLHIFANPTVDLTVGLAVQLLTALVVLLALALAWLVTWLQHDHCQPVLCIVGCLLLAAVLSALLAWSAHGL